MLAERVLRIVSRRGLALAGLTSAALLATTAGTAAAAGPGTPDPNFGSGGSAGLPANTRLFADAAQSNGDIVAVGESGTKGNPRVLLARFTPAGKLDSSFGTGGIASGPSVGGGSIARAVAIQPDGKIVVVGKATDTTGSATSGLLVERFNANGSPDGSFGTGGVVDLLATTSGDGYAVAIQPNGDIVAGGQDTPSTSPYAVVARLDSGGHPDGSFGSGGIDVLNLGAFSIVQSLAVQGNGAIVLAGSQSPGFQATNALLARLKPNGALDTSFHGSGAVTLSNFTGGAYISFNGVALQSNGAIDVAGSAAGAGNTADLVVARYTSSGNLDGSFGSHGLATSPAATNYLGQSNSTVPGGQAIAIAGNGDIIAAGQYDRGVLAYGTMWALTSSGRLDTSFGTQGAAAFQSSTGLNSEFFGLAVSPVTGNPIGAGDTLAPGGGHYAGLAVSYIGYGRPKNGGSTPLKLTITHVKVSYKDGYLKFTAACNQACSLTTQLTAGAGAARQLKLATTVKKCKKSHGKTKCRRVREYRTIRLASARATLHKAGSHGFTLRLSRGARNALHRQRSVTLSYQVIARGSSGATVKFNKNVKFRR